MPSSRNQSLVRDLLSLWLHNPRTLSSFLAHFPALRLRSCEPNAFIKRYNQKSSPRYPGPILKTQVIWKPSMPKTICSPQWTPISWNYPKDIIISLWIFGQRNPRDPWNNNIPAIALGFPRELGGKTMFLKILTHIGFITEKSSETDLKPSSPLALFHHCRWWCLDCWVRKMQQWSQSAVNVIC